MQGLAKKSSKDVQIALDIGSYSIKAAAISHAKPRPLLLDYSIVSIGDNIIKAISQAYDELNIAKTKVVASVSGGMVIARYIHLPSMSDEELEGAIRFEAEKVIPYNMDDVQLDFAKIEDLDDNKMRVVMVAAKKDLIEIQIRMLSEAGLEPAIFDADLFAVINAFMNADVDKTGVCGVLNIGFHKSNLSVIKEGKPYLSRDIEIGGRNIVKIIADNLSIPEKEALKIFQDKLGTFDTLTEDDRKVAEAPIADVLSRLADEAVLSFDFYENQHSNNVSKIFISGGMSIPKFVEGFLKEALGRDLQTWNPITNIDISEDIDSNKLMQLAPQLAVVTGLALRKTK